MVGVLGRGTLGSGKASRDWTPSVGAASNEGLDVTDKRVNVRFGIEDSMEY